MDNHSLLQLTTHYCLHLVAAADDYKVFKNLQFMVSTYQIIGIL